jgi:hypothetical protein
VHTSDESWGIYVREVKAYTGGGTTPPNPGNCSTTKATGTIIGGTAYSDAYSMAKAMDGLTGTAFAGINANENWVGLDLGTPQSICTIKYYPRGSNFNIRMNNGRFEGSTSANFSNPVTLHTISGTPSYAYTTVPITNTTEFRYVRYIAAYGDVAEVEFYTRTGGGTTPPPPPPPTGNGVGYYWRNLASASSDGTATTPKVRADEINDGNTTTTKTIVDNDQYNERQAVGLVWSTARTGISKVEFYNGTVDYWGGAFSPGEAVRVQYQATANGPWVNAPSSWSITPAYAYSDPLSSNRLYTFNANGTNLPSCVGVRVIGQVKTDEVSWAVYFREMKVFAGTNQISSVTDNAASRLQLNQNTVADNITVFPNPVKDGWLTVGLNAADKNNRVDVLVSDLSGRVVLKSSFTSNGISERLNLGNVQPGVYVIRITGANTTFSSKVIVE